MKQCTLAWAIGQLFSVFHISFDIYILIYTFDHIY